MNSLWQNVRSPRLVVVFSLAILLFSGISLSAQEKLDGKALFNGNCASCHKASSVKSIGPGLKDVVGRVPDGDWIYKWVKDNNALRASGNNYANNIFKEYNGSIMPAFHALTNEQIDAIIAYANPGPAEPKVAGPSGATDTTGPTATTNEGSPLFIIIVIFILLIILIAVLRFAKINLRNAVNEKEGLPEEPGLPFIDASRKWINENKRKVALIGLFLFSVLVVKGWYAMKGVGVYAQEVKPGEWVGYHPAQPINFSHKIHAGDNAIQCQYCHSTVEKSKTASIPSANVCMNCHKEIKETANEGSKEEIAKIYEAVGWNSTGNYYTGKEKPIQWVKVHALPDHVFFSHQQHVVVGQVACEECHGDVKKMVTVEQQRPLTMGWCITCHRETPVKMDGNGYYSELHEKMKEKYKGQPITVAMAGGIECARCHY